MEFELKGWMAAVGIVVVLVVLKFFNAGVMHNYPTEEQIKEKVGQQIIDIIYADAIFAQSEMFEQAENNEAKQAAIRQAKTELEALKQVQLGAIGIEPYRIRERRNMLKRDTVFLINVEYTVGVGGESEFIVLELSTAADKNWHVMKTFHSF
jgi:hypothetical protein